jgi:N-acetylglucosaminyldiphosphoundecaprenol N-acetyl-beta-D-mannosaminyltransferase
VHILFIGSPKTAAAASSEAVGTLASALEPHHVVSTIEVRAPEPRSGFLARLSPGEGSEPSKRFLETVLASDRVVTNGWDALLAFERLNLVADLHLLDDFGQLLPVSAKHDPARSFELLNRARTIVATRPEDVRALRAQGRFAFEFLGDRQVPDDPWPDRQNVETQDLRSWFESLPAGERSAVSLAEAVASVAPRALVDLAALVDLCLDGSHEGRVQTINLQHIYLAQRSAILRETIAGATAITADGWPIVELLTRAGRAIERVTGADLVPSLVQDPRMCGSRLALIGGLESVGDSFQLVAEQAGATVAVREHGDKRDWDPLVLARQLNEQRCTLALIAVTQPAGDLLAAELNRAGFCGIAIGIGAAVELYVGGERRAAPLVQRLRLEWAFRLIQDPKRLWRRYLVEGVPTYLGIVRPLSRRLSVPDKR